MRERLESLVADLVGINSVNSSLSGGPGENEIAGRVAAMLTAAGVHTRQQRVPAGGANVVATIQGRTSGRTVLLNAHLDTVGVEGMDRPFSLTKTGDRLYGRGAYDMKGSAAVMIAIAEHIASKAPPGDVILAFVADEEDRSTGTEHLLSDWLPTLSKTPDAAFVLEPTEEVIGIAHKGFAWFEIMIHGRAAHGSRPEQGVDAVLPLGPALRELSQISEGLGQQTPDPLLGTGTLHVSTLEGGSSWSVIPEQARLGWERRTLPREQTHDLDLELDRVVKAVQSTPGSHRVEGRKVFERRAFHTAPESLPVRMLRAAAPDLSTGGVSFWADAALFGEHMPTALFGPIGHGAHAVDEWVSLDSLLRVAESLIRVIESTAEFD